MKAAHDQGKEYTPNKTITEEYKDITVFYEGILRENALFVFLYNQIVNGGNFDEIEPLVKEYGKKYTKNKYFKNTLTNMMQ